MAVASPSLSAVKEAGRISITNASGEIGSGGTTILIPAADNTAGLLVWSVTITSTAAGGTGGYVVQDVVQSDDAAGTLMCPCNIGLAAGGGSNSNSAPYSCEGIFVPAGCNVLLVNGGAGGSPDLRKCSAAIYFTLLV